MEKLTAYFKYYELIYLFIEDDFLEHRILTELNILC